MSSEKDGGLVFPFSIISRFPSRPDNTAAELLETLRAVLEHNARLDPHHQKLCKVCGPALALIARAEARQ